MLSGVTQQRCTICRLPAAKRAEIEAAYEGALAASDVEAAVLDLASRRGVSRLALRRHSTHVGTSLGADLGGASVIPSSPQGTAIEPTQSAPAASRSNSTANDLPDPGGGSVVDRARALLGYLAVPGRTTQELAQAREIRAALTLEARLVGAMTTKAKLHEHPDWGAHVEAIVTSLARVPGALDALEGFLARADERGAAT